MIQFLSALAILIITGLAILAYRHPAGYRSIARQAGQASALIALSVCIMLIGEISIEIFDLKDIGTDAISKNKDSYKIPTASIILLAHRSKILLLAIGFTGAIFAGGAFFWHLPRIISDVKTTNQDATAKIEPQSSEPEKKD